MPRLRMIRRSARRRRMREFSGRKMRFVDFIICKKNINLTQFIYDIQVDWKIGIVNDILIVGSLDI